MVTLTIVSHGNNILVLNYYFFVQTITFQNVLNINYSVFECIAYNYAFENVGLVLQTG